MGNTNINDISALSSLTNLMILDLRYNNISDISVLSSLTNLEELYLNGNNISDINVLSSLVKLRYLGLGGSNISDVSALSSLTNLMTLDLNGNNISDVSALSSLTNLKDLNLNGNNISDISALSSLVKLTDLRLRKNNISDISALGSLTNLEELDLNGNNISDISALSSLTNLMILDLRYNNISDISVLSSLTKLNKVWYSGNPVSELSVVNSINSDNSIENFFEENWNTQNINSREYSYFDDEEQMEPKQYGTSLYKSASGTDLLPNETYNFYILKSVTVEQLLGAENLLYIGQTVSDENGQLNILYEPREDYDAAEMFVVGMTRTDIALSDIQLGDLTYNGQEQIVNPVVVYNGTLLIAGLDYEICGDYSATEPGEYTLIITGIGRYKGIKQIQYFVIGNKPVIPQEKEQVYGFVNRLYSLVLQRTADEAGLDSWVEALLNQTSNGVDAGYGFVFSAECKNRNLSNEDFVEMLYNTFMNRPSDEGGKTAWVSQLAVGVDREKILEGFILSEEFAQICNEYGISVGDTSDVTAFSDAITHYRNQNAELTKFVARCYTEALGRTYEIEGLEAWCKVIIEKSNTPKQVAQNFIFSDEFVQKDLSDEEYVKVLYRTFMGREADEGGLTAWVAVLESGKENRAKVLEGFSDSVEFSGILQSFGLN